VARFRQSHSRPGPASTEQRESSCLLIFKQMIWIDGLAEVAECRVQSCSNMTSIDAFASGIKPAEDSNFGMARFHNVDYDYQEFMCHGGEPSCVCSDLSQLFPFLGSLEMTYWYLRCAAQNMHIPFETDNERWIK
jgi:hypothetical protein